jgi:carboxylesterase
VWPGTRRLGCVLVHGFTATPDEVRPLGDALAAAGFPCRAVRLPGHGTQVADLATVGHRDWLAAVGQAVRRMAADGSPVALAGVSLGALLSLAVAGAGDPPVRALALLGTPLRFADERAALLRFVAWVPGAIGPTRVVRKRHGRDILDEAARARSSAYDAMPLAGVVELLRLRAIVKRLLHRVTHPTLVLHGRHDRTAPVANVELLRRRLPARPLEVTVFERSAHVLTEDAERDAVAARVVRFLSRCDAEAP